MQAEKMRLRPIEYAEIDDVLNGLDAGMGCVAIQQSLGTPHNIVRSILRAEHPKMLDRQRQYAKRIQMAKHPAQIRSVEPPRTRRRKVHRADAEPVAAPTPSAGDDNVRWLMDVYDAQVAQLQRENTVLRRQIIEMGLQRGRVP